MRRGALRVPTYGDIVTGCLLLQEGAMSPHGLWVALRDMGAAEQSLSLIHI